MAATGLPETIGNFRILSKLGQGGMGVVFRAVHGTLERPVALKLLPAEFSNHPEYVMRFLREARTIASLRHENIVQVYDAGEQNGQYYIAMELVDGCNLLQYSNDKKSIPEPEILNLLQQASRGLAAAHANNLVHRDIKPENLLLGSDRILRMVDFGLVMESSSSTQLTASGACLGTPMYMSPEQADGDIADARTDIYSLGATFFRVVTGQPPFESPTVMNLLFKHKFETPPNPKTLRRDISENLSNLLLTMMAKRREDRPQSALKLLEMIDGIQQGHPIPHPSRYVASVPSNIASGNQNKIETPRMGKWVAAALFTIAGVVGVGIYFAPKETADMESSAADTHLIPVQKSVQKDTKINFLALGDECASSRNYAKALEYFREGLIADASSTPLKMRIENTERILEGIALMRSGEALEQKGDLEEALSKFNAALLLKELTAQEAVSRVVHKQTQIRNVTSDHTRMEQREVCAKNAANEEKSSHYSQATDWYSKAASLSDGAMRTMFAEKASDCRRRDHLSKALEAEKTGDLNTAKTFYEKALAVRQDELVQNNYETLLKKMKETEAVLAVEIAFDRAMKDGLAALTKNDFASAKTHFATAKGLKSNAIEPQNKLLEVRARELISLGDAARETPTLALKHYRDALTLCPPLDEQIQARIKKCESLPPPTSVVLQTLEANVRADHLEKALAALVDALKADPQNAELKRAKEALENMQACSSIYAEISLLNASAFVAVDEGCLIDDDQKNKDMKDNFQIIKKNAAERSKKTRPHFLNQEYETVKSNLETARKDALHLFKELENAETYYENRATKAAEKIGSSIPLIKKLELGSDPKKAAKYKKLAETFKKLSIQATPLKE